MPPVPATLARTTVELYGPSGVEWLRRLPALLDEYAARWTLALGPPFEPLSYNYVAPVTRMDGTSAVLKAGFPGGELLTEIEALRLFDGRGSVALLEVDSDRGVMLLERLRPGLGRAGRREDQKGGRPCPVPLEPSAASRC